LELKQDQILVFKVNLIFIMDDFLNFKEEVKHSLDLFRSPLDMTNKLFCTFSTIEEYADLVEVIKHRYNILFDKIFVLECLDTDEVVCTYNVDLNNVNDFIEGTILVHRKKHTNTLYSINALNELIKELNFGRLDKNFIVDWNDYRNTILLTREGSLQIIKTKLLEIITL